MELSSLVVLRVPLATKLSVVIIAPTYLFLCCLLGSASDVFFLLLLLPLFEQTFMPPPEFNMHLFCGSHFSLRPWMPNNVSQFESLGGILLHHACEEVDEFVAEASVLESCMHIPELVSLVSDEPLVMSVVLFSLGEGRVASVHDEEDNGG